MIPTLLNCPYCACFHGPKECNIPNVMMCSTCSCIFHKNRDRTILKPGKDVDDLV